MNITDVPQSGARTQQGAIFQIVAQLIDFNTISPSNPTGDPIQLQTASGLSISILYPDGVTTLTVPAVLATDGSDGMIVYTTVNNGTQIDLSQIGLYHFQGNAVVGGVQLPPSYQDDFYVMANVTGNPSPAPIYQASAVIFFDTNGVRWAQSVSPSGLSAPVLQPSGPANFLLFQNLVMVDSNGIYWKATMSTVGVLSWATTAQTASALGSFILNDSNGRSWICTISTSGVLGAA
jgi:hypothetical protein